MTNPQTEPKVERRIFDSYMAFTKNSVGSKSWSQYYADIDGVKTEIVQDGNLACAYFVSSVLRIFNLIERVHMTVPRTVADMKESGWAEIDKARPGAVVVYDDAHFSNGSFPHIGICTSGETAISNNYKAGTPIEHNIVITNEDGSERKIVGYYWHSQLEVGHE